MRRRLLAFALSAIMGAAVYAVTAHATAGYGFTGTTLAQGRLSAFHVKNKVRAADWESELETEGQSDLYVQSNVWKAKNEGFPEGSSTGWHTHPGPSLITVIQGTLSAYDADDPSCAPHMYSVGESFVDPGGDHVHLLRNDDEFIEARTIAVQLVPAGAARRVDAPKPTQCTVQ